MEFLCVALYFKEEKGQNVKNVPISYKLALSDAHIQDGVISLRDLKETPQLCGFSCRPHEPLWARSGCSFNFVTTSTR